MLSDLKWQIGAIFGILGVMLLVLLGWQYNSVFSGWNFFRATTNNITGSPTISPSKSPSGLFFGILPIANKNNPSIPPLPLSADTDVTAPSVSPTVARGQLAANATPATYPSPIIYTIDDNNNFQVTLGTPSPAAGTSIYSYNVEPAASLNPSPSASPSASPSITPSVSPSKSPSASPSPSPSRLSVASAAPSPSNYYCQAAPCKFKDGYPVCNSGSSAMYSSFGTVCSCVTISGACVVPLGAVPAPSPPPVLSLGAFQPTAASSPVSSPKAITQPAPAAPAWAPNDGGSGYCDHPTFCASYPYGSLPRYITNKALNDSVASQRQCAPGFSLSFDVDYNDCPAGACKVKSCTCGILPNCADFAPKPAAYLPSPQLALPPGGTSSKDLRTYLNPSVYEAEVLAIFKEVFGRMPTETESAYWISHSNLTKVSGLTLSQEEDEINLVRQQMMSYLAAQNSTRMTDYTIYKNLQWGDNAKIMIGDPCPGFGINYQWYQIAQGLARERIGVDLASLCAYAKQQQMTGAYNHGFDLQRVIQHARDLWALWQHSADLAGQISNATTSYNSQLGTSVAGSGSTWSWVKLQWQSFTLLIGNLFFGYP